MDLQTLQIPSAQAVQELLHEYTGQGAQAIAAALTSPNPTRHEVHLPDGTHIFTWCALDTLLVPRLLGVEAKISTIVPGTAHRLDLEIVAGHLAPVPPQWVVSFPAASDENGASFTTAFCPYANAFTYKQQYERWAADQPRHTTPISFARADEIARQYRLIVDLHKSSHTGGDANSGTAIASCLQ